MNIVILPIRYPSPQSPTLGVFFQEQVNALIELIPEWQFALSFVEHHQLHLREPKTWPGFISGLKTAQPQQIQRIKHNFWIAYHQVPRWTYRILQGNLNARLRSHRRHIQRLLTLWGHIDLIHAHVTWPSGWIAWQLSQEFNIPYIITEHMSPFPYPYPYLIHNGQLTSLIVEPIKSAKAVIAVSPFLVQHMQNLGLSGVQYIPNIVDETRFYPAQRQETPSFVFATLCRIEEQKGIPDLLQAIALLKDDYPQFKFRIGGKGSKLKACQKLERELNLSDCVEWVGPILPEDAPAFFNAADAYVMPSYHETFGVVFAEALACGKPLIATRCGGPEVIVTPENGLLVDPGEPAQIANALVRIFKNKDKYPPEKLHQDFLSRFSRPAVIEQLKKLYEGLMI